MTMSRKLPEAVRLASLQPLFGVSEENDTLPDRVIRYAFSDSSVARDNHTIAANAWAIENFLRNPVFLWAHESGAPPIGRVVNLRSENGILRGDVEYADREIYPFADTVYRLVKGGFVNATSTSWIPLDWTISRNKSRPGGVDFTKVELLEISQVPVPALPTALVEARRQGIDTKPVFDWAEQMLDSGGYTILPRAELEALRLEAKGPLERKVAPEVTPEVTAEAELPVEVTTEKPQERALKPGARQRLIKLQSAMHSVREVITESYSDLTSFLDDTGQFDDETEEDPSEPDDDNDGDEMTARRLRKARAKARLVKLSPAVPT